MEVSWVFRCDAGHRWEYQLGPDEAPTQEQLTCPHDSQTAVTATPMPAADRVVIKLIPAARVADRVSNRVDRDDAFLLEITNRDGTARLVSARPRSWNDAVARAGAFRRASWDDAIRRWKRMGLGNARDDVDG